MFTPISPFGHSRLNPSSGAAGLTRRPNERGVYRKAYGSAGQLKCTVRAWSKLPADCWLGVGSTSGEKEKCGPRSRLAILCASIIVLAAYLGQDSSLTPQPTSSPYSPMISTGMRVALLEDDPCQAELLSHWLASAGLVCSRLRARSQLSARSNARKLRCPRLGLEPSRHQGLGRAQACPQASFNRRFQSSSSAPAAVKLTS